MSPEEINIDALVDKSTKNFIQTVETIIGRHNCSEKLWITNEIIQLCKDKRAVTNRQDPENRDTYKHIKRLKEKKIKCALIAYIYNKYDQCELGFQKGNTHAVYKRKRELSRCKTTLTDIILHKDGTPINDVIGIRER
ncbi:hypothetical protein QYM36_007384 [Artemia franciscana]|uniref:Uncharacterized protein n=1 Tax=Artemia franciscana TaxID=6661 RepID=A0AA88I2Y8_ARTSF|nr:hypothetical protein QYM36_007384 [Artemia franciscana]